jgi:hypothetical protein
MSENGSRKVDHTRFKWAVVAGLLALILVLGTIQELVK